MATPAGAHHHCPVPEASAANCPAGASLRTGAPRHGPRPGVALRQRSQLPWKTVWGGCYDLDTFEKARAQASVRLCNPVA